MNASEQRTIAFHFHELAEKMQALYEEAGSIADKYPRFRQEEMYLNLRGFLQAAMEEADGLQDYIAHAADENWKIERSSDKGEPS